jgi:uncharacterized peroxidase-related enzyme
MARVQLIQPEAASTEVQHIYEHRLRGKPGNSQKAMGHLPDTLTAFLAFYSTVGRSLDRRLYELVYIRISMINGCDYCLQHHLAGSRRAGLTPEDWRQLRNPASSTFTDKEKAALVFTEKLTRTPSAIEEADFVPLRQHGFTDPQIVDLHLLTGLANLTNRFTGPLGLELEMPAETIP